MSNISNVTLENVKIIFKNFQGQKGQFNAQGDRSFSILIEDPRMADDMRKDGWAVKPLRPDEDGVVRAYHLSAKVNYNSSTPPRIYRVWPNNNNRRLLLNPDTIGMLDELPIETADLIINPYEWHVNDNSGIKAYVNTMYVIIEENELDLKWAEIPEAPFDDPIDRMG